MEQAAQELQVTTQQMIDLFEGLRQPNESPTDFVQQLMNYPNSQISKLQRLQTTEYSARWDMLHNLQNITDSLTKTHTEVLRSKNIKQVPYMDSFMNKFERIIDETMNKIS